jgi:hypothetical protein
VKFTRDCVFLAPALDQASQLKLTEIKEKVGSIERLLERDVAKSLVHVSSGPSQERALPDDEDDNLPANEDEKDLEPTPLAVVDAAYEVDGEDDDLLDLGIQLGKMRITERIGGFFRPKISQEVGVTTFLVYLVSPAFYFECQSAPSRRFVNLYSAILGAVLYFLISNYVSGTSHLAAAAGLFVKT